MSYHCMFAIGHFARQLAAQCTGKRKSYQPLAVLQALWFRADPMADAPVVRLEPVDLDGLTTSAPNLRQVIARLAKLGAVERLQTADRTYRLRKPAESDLDDVARDALECARALAPFGQQATSNAPDSSATSAHRSKLASQQDRSAMLKRLQKKPSDVARMLEGIAGLPPDTLVFRGKGPGSGPVLWAESWLVESGATWATFEALCAAAQRDPNRPEKTERLFGGDYADYREALLQRMSGGTAADGGEVKRMGTADLVRTARWLAQHKVIEMDRAFAVLDSRWAALADVSQDTFREAVQTWLDTPAEQRPSIEDAINELI